MWIFAYGSLMFRPSFEYIERRRAFVRGWARRLWQGSPDHRGVPGAPGRVVTLVSSSEREREPSAHCGGCAYRIDATQAEVILYQLDVREQAGFERRMMPLFTSAQQTADDEPFADGLTWVANPGNSHFLGPLPEPEIAAYIKDRSGPSGTNADYVVRLHEALGQLDIDDPHVTEVVRHLKSQP